MHNFLVLLPFCGLLSSASAARVDVRADSSANATASIPSPTLGPDFKFGTFSFPTATTDRYATPLKSPLVIPTPYAPHFSKASTLLPPNITYTTWSLNPNATATNDGPYGQSAFAALWSSAGDYYYADNPPFTTTVSPTPIASSELVYPPPIPVVPVDWDDVAGMDLPADFIWGAASSAWQVEGGLKLDGRGPANNDVIGALNGPSPEANSSNVNAMHYYLYKQDILRMAAMGLPHFCFSIPWVRIMPFGVAGSPVNQAALDHYEDVLETALANGITPVVTLVHFDWPVAIPYESDKWVAGYLEYAKQVMTRFGDRVPYWVSINEPNLETTDDGLTNVLVGHALLYDWYKNELGGTGKITIKFANNLALPLDPDNSDDVKAALRYQDFSLGIMSNPLFLSKQYPDSVLNTTGIQLHALNETQLKLIGGKIDFFSFDPYSSQYATSPPGGIDACAADPSNSLWPGCVVVSEQQANGWLIGQPSAVPYCYIASRFVRWQLAYVWDTFQPKGGILVSEYGFPTYLDQLQDLAYQRFDIEKTIYYYAFMTEVLKSIHLDGVNVIGAIAWAFLDTNEFGTFDDHYGLQTVNHTSFQRTYKRSFFDFVDFFHEKIAKS